MSQITDLTGTKWEFNESINISYFYGMYAHILFYSNEKLFMRFGVDYEELDDYYYLAYGTTKGYTQVYNTLDNVWTKQAYRTVQIIGGDDATNPNLIALLPSIATQITEKISIGTQPLVSASVGNAEMQAIWVGNVKVYEATETP